MLFSRKSTDFNAIVQTLENYLALPSLKIQRGSLREGAKNTPRGVPLIWGGNQLWTKMGGTTHFVQGNVKMSRNAYALFEKKIFLEMGGT